MSNLDQRSLSILLSLVKLFIASGKPVPSRALAIIHNLSPASIRISLAYLQKLGLLTHPHHSAGRIPTDKAYRIYADSIIKQAKLSKKDELTINRSLLGSKPTSIADFMERTSQLLSQLSGNVGIVIPPSPAQDILQHVEFIKLTEGKILVITVSQSGIVRDRVIHLDTHFTQDELHKTARFLLDNFKGLTIQQIRDSVLKRLAEEKNLYDRLLQNTLLLCNDALQAQTDKPEVYVEGTSTILSKPDFIDNTQKLRELFKIYEEKEKLLKLLNEYLKEPTTAGVCIRIGSENSIPTMHSCTIITSPYSYGKNAFGGVGIVGPTRLEYPRLITIVNYIARIFERVLNDTSNFTE
ncbi:MAG: heat-inducible transcriptional repressor HrcA [Acidobacteriota bacterium]|nr:heat-inducible transcriptional repressor HrcA [Blastocatellia bacterium]MDW8411417.1 heat-inducible transcriptional repressor HrcA [Acidobacteriota bacterium]